MSTDCKTCKNIIENALVYLCDPQLQPLFYRMDFEDYVRSYVCPACGSAPMQAPNP